MKRLFWIAVLLVGIALGGVSVWYLANAESGNGLGNSQTVVSQPKLIAEPSKADSSHIPQGEITDEPIEENTEGEQLSGEPEVVETTQPLQSNAVVEKVDNVKEQAAEIVEAKAETKMEVIEVSAAPLVQEADNQADKQPAIAVLPFKVMGDAFNFNKDTGDILCDAFVSE